MASVLSSIEAAKPIIPEVKPVELRDFTDVGAIRKNIYDKVLGSVKAISPLQNSRHTLEVSKLHYADPEEYSLAKQKQTILSGKSLYRRLRGTWRLKDNATGTVLDERPMTIAQVPHMTPRGTFILNGTEYQISSQSRLRPGIFTRIKDNGEIESHVNVLPGNGRSHRYFLDPESGIFKINIGQAKLPLLPVLKALGISETELRHAWGDEIVSANLKAPEAKTINKLYQRLVKKPDSAASNESKAKAIAEVMLSMKLDPEVTERTLGKPHEFLTKDAVLDATKKLLAVSRQEAQPDARDHLAFQTFHGPEDLLSERITKDRPFLRQLLWRISFKGNLANMQPGVLTRQLHSTLLHTGLGQAVEQVNNAELLDGLMRSTRLGEGGISGIDSIPEESKSVENSQLNFIDPIKTSESSKAGIDIRIAHMVKKGSDGKLYAPFRDIKTGKIVYKTPQDVADVPVVFPGELDKGRPYVRAVYEGQVKYVPIESARYEVPHMEQAFSPLSAMIPMKSGIKGQRSSMGARFLAQSLPILHNEAPLVQAAMPGQHMKRSFEQHYGPWLGAIKAEQDGVVKKLTPDDITVKYNDGSTKTYDLYNNFAYARKTGNHNDPLVKVGDRISKDQVLAKSLYTDHEGTAALGLNAKTIFIPYKGKNYEDAVTISEGFAKKLTSIHMYQHEQEWSDTIRKGKNPFVSLFASAFEKKQIDNMDPNGVIRPGTVVNYGDPLVLVAEERERTHSQIHRGRKPTYSNKSITWEHHSPGVVTDTVPTSKGISVTVKALSPMQVGDKLSLRGGSKGVVGEIVPDDKMLKDESGEPYELAVNSLGMISRINPALTSVEALLSKIAKKTGIPYKIEDFKDIDDLAAYANQEAKKYGVSDYDTVTDPETGRKIPNVLSGYPYVLKLHHTAESKGQSRSFGDYSSTEVPAKGGGDASKMIGLLETNALLSHGASEVLRDAHLIRGQKNEPYWQAVMSGFRPIDPNIPLVYRKFVDEFRGAGLNVVPHGRQLHIMAMTDKDVNALAGHRYLQNADTVDWKEGLKPKKGGLFDPALSGGHGGNRWSSIPLYEPMPNPAFEEPIRRLLGLTQERLENVIAGKEQLNEFGTGPGAVKKALEAINLPKAIQQARTEIAGTKRTARDEAIRKLAYLKSAQRLRIHPKDWILSKVPVLPPLYRPVSAMVGSGNQLVADANYLYKELFDANENLKELKGKVSDISHERLNVYNAFKGVVGLGDPIQPKNQERRVKGLLQHIFGNSPKFGTMQMQLLSSKVDLVGRAVVVPNSNLDLDQVGLPEQHAWEIYKPFIIRRLVQHGMPRLDAARAFLDRQDIAKDAMLKEMSERPIVMTRAPVLHRYGVVGSWPILIKGDTLQTNPLINKGLGLDHDGDAMNFHVVASEEAKKEVIEKLMPSRNLLSPSEFKAHYLPNQEYQGGIYHASTAKNDKKHAEVFRNVEDAKRAYYEGRINLDTPVKIIQP